MTHEPKKDPQGTPDQISEARGGLIKLCALLDGRRLTLAERKEYGGVIAQNPRSLVGQVCRALDRAPEAFAHYPVKGEGLRQGQARADEWLYTVCLLEELLAECQDRYLREQGEVLRKARCVVEAVRADGKQLYSAEDPRLRRLRQVAVAGSEWVLEERQKQRATKARRNRRKREAARGTV